MKLIKKNMALLIVIIMALGLMGGCAATLKPAIHLDSSFHVQKIDIIVMLPAVDARFDKTVELEVQKLLNINAKSMLKKRGYEVQIINTDGTESQITKDDLESLDSEWIKQLGPDDANWVMVLALDDATSKLTFGSTGSAEVSGFFFDKQSGVLLWRDIGIGKVGQGGLFGMMMKSAMGDMAIINAVSNLIMSIPPQPK